jgi:hypothetical protein
MSAPVAIKKTKAGRKALQVEVNNPDQSTQWKFLWELDKKDWIQTQTLIDELNIINAPIQLRIVLTTASISDSKISTDT